MNARSQPVLPAMFDVSIARLHKPARQTSREIYRRQRDADQVREAAGLETRRGRVLWLLAAFWNRWQRSPTASELFAFAAERNEPFRNVAELRPRLTELVRAGLIEPRGKRRCIVTGAVVHVWAIREIGSQEPR
jgi:hypothetical protein